MKMLFLLLASIGLSSVQAKSTMPRLAQLKNKVEQVLAAGSSDSLKLVFEQGKNVLKPVQLRDIEKRMELLHWSAQHGLVHELHNAQKLSQAQALSVFKAYLLKKLPTHRVPLVACASELLAEEDELIACSTDAMRLMENKEQSVARAEEIQEILNKCIERKKVIEHLQVFINSLLM